MTLLLILQSSLTECTGLRVGQVRLIFSIPENAKDAVFEDKADDVPQHLAYIEWFSRRPAQRSKWSGLYAIKRSVEEDDRLVSILPADRIVRSVSLYPNFGPDLNISWTRDNVLEKCSNFFMNPFSDKHTYIMMDKKQYW